MAGIDKVPYTERIVWINANESKILESAEDPLQNRFWSNQDSPFQFLVFCVEYKRYKKHIDDFGTPIGFKTGNHEFKDFRYTCERLNTEAETKRLQHEVFEYILNK